MSQWLRRIGRKTNFQSILIVLLLVLSALPILCQVSAKKAGPTQFKLASIQVSGNKHYSSDQIVGLTGLQIGQNVSDDGKAVNEDIFREAAKRIGDTGAFRDISYRYEYSGAGTKLELKVVEDNKFVVAVFDNFVWFTDEELLTTLRSRVPLFDGNLPASGTVADRIADTLQQMLADRKVPGTVDFILTGQAGGPLSAMNYKVSGVTVRIREMAFPGAGTSELPLLETAAKPLVGQDYSRSTLRIQEEKNFMPVFLARGYLKAHFSDSQGTISKSDQETILADVTFPVSTGAQYKLEDIQWVGNTVFPAEKLRSIIQVRKGEPANAVQLNEGIESIKELYSTVGYLTARCEATPAFDDSVSVVRYTLEVKEGDQFRMGKFEVEGLDSSTAQAVMGAWKMRSGEPYDNTYPAKRFSVDLKNARVSIPRDLDVKMQEKINANEKTVDVKMVFATKKPS